MTQIDSAALARLVRKIVLDTIGAAFGGEPGVYNNASLTIDRTGAIRFVAGGGEVGFDWQGGTAGNGTICYVAPYRLVFGDAVSASDGTPTISYAVSAGGTAAFAGTAVPLRMERGDALRVVCSGLAGSVEYAALTLVRDFAGTVTV